MKLYMHPVSTACRPVRLLIAENGIKCDEEMVDILKGAHYQEPYASLNPNRMVPMLEDGDFRLTESSAILKYLADKYDLPSYPKDLKKRAKVNEMMDWLNTQFYRDFGYGLVYPQLFPHHKRRSDEAHAGADRLGTAGRQELAADSQRPLDRAEQPVSVRQRAHDCRLFRRRRRVDRRTDRLRLLRLSQHQALARQHEEAEVLEPGQRGVQRLRRRQQGQGVRTRVRACRPAAKADSCKKVMSASPRKADMMHCKTKCQPRAASGHWPQRTARPLSATNDVEWPMNLSAKGE